MYAIIVGAGRTGLAIASWLLNGENEVTVVDRSVAKCESLEDLFGGVAVLGDGAEYGVLAKAGTNRADVVVAATGMDDVNLVTCQIAMHRFAVKRTVAVIQNPEYQELFETLGIGTVVNATRMITDNMMSALSGITSESP
ncbi:MAG: hypothetical protein BZY79_03615 [SAR202 cluster bacterium Casp-Chloro-G4]|nr:TrkA family potassium uptake protein [Chloroflexota bacterium]MDA1227852.1 TrkA family potassium uptake protein [Chloroflexota bacterium]PKB61460.1 MAG: hypothetical protein BZY79_03615 [SAR202 cluster bacterium Casp-Chloro-G4]